MGKYKFICKSDLSLSVKLPNGGSKHVRFIPQTGGGSVFYTAEEGLAEALRNHPKFGRLYKELHVPNVLVEPRKEVVAEVQRDVKVVKAACVDDAKDYLSIHFGVSRTKMRSTKAIMDIAKSYNIEFDGI